MAAVLRQKCAWCAGENQVWLEQMSGKRYEREDKRPNYARHCQDLGFYWEWSAAPLQSFQQKGMGGFNGTQALGILSTSFLHNRTINKTLIRDLLSDFLTRHYVETWHAVTHYKINAIQPESKWLEIQNIQISSPTPQTTTMMTTQESRTSSKFPKFLQLTIKILFLLL